MLYKRDIPLASEYTTLLEVWESSVRATHHFLAEDDITFFRDTITENNLFESTDIVVARDEDEKIVGFMGTSGDSLDMIFISPEHIGKGLGRMLMSYAIDELKITKVDVNEQNSNAAGFYKHFGFKVSSRSEQDETGKPYPILHMQR